LQILVNSWIERGGEGRKMVNIQRVCAKSLAVTPGHLIVGPGRMQTGGGGLGWRAVNAAGGAGGAPSHKVMAPYHLGPKFQI
jgi:hypothetical protein